MESEAHSPAMVEPPLGMYPGRLDEKGRVKLPVAFQQYFSALYDKKLFVTSLDRRIAKIYPVSNWRANQKKLESDRENPRIARNILFNASDLGVEAEMDSQGRVTFPPELRRELGIENAPVRLYGTKGHIEVLSENLYDERKKQAAETTEEDVIKMEAAGLI